MWVETPFEKQIYKALTEQAELGVEKGTRYYTHYQDARDYLVTQVYPEIAAKEPNLTSHSPDHVADVQKNIDLILKSQYSTICGMDLYFLGLLVLFHDAGNRFGRKDHHHYEKITKVYDQHFHRNPLYTQERRLVARAAQAHSGRSTDGSSDTIKGLQPSDSIDGYPIRVREMATLLRFADELCEGPHRTSQASQDWDLYSDDSRIYHEYANVTTVYIDRGNERIALTYNIVVDDGEGPLAEAQETWLRGLLNFTYERIHKLDQERKYARHYCPLCADFKRTTVSINIDRGSRPVVNLENCELNDVTVPGQAITTSLVQQYPEYDVNAIINLVEN